MVVLLNGKMAGPDDFALTHLQLATVYFQPTLSYKISDKLGLGAGFVYGIGSVNSERYAPC